jgi:hypothetical protein
LNAWSWAFGSPPGPCQLGTTSSSSRGKNDDQHEKAGAIVFLAPDEKAELGRVKLAGVGIYRLVGPAASDGTEQVGRIQAGLYCERMELAV